MARLLCSYGARPRHSHNNQGQTPLALAKYVLKNPKMTKLLASFSPTSTPKQSKVSTNGAEAENVSESIEDIQNSPEDAIIPMELPFRRTARASCVDGSCKRLQRTAVGVELPNPTPMEGVEQYGKKTPSSEMSNNASISGRPYLHRQVKGGCSQCKTLF